jgi:hypothetical protein
MNKAIFERDFKQLNKKDGVNIEGENYIFYGITSYETSQPFLREYVKLYTNKRVVGVVALDSIRRME